MRYRVSKFLLYVTLPLWVQACLLGCVAEGGSPVTSTSSTSDLGLQSAAPETVVVPGMGRLPIQHVGLPALVQTSGNPPSGEGVAPIIGAGGDGLAVVTGSGVAVGGVSGPGAVRWHGGQWLIPYGATPGSVLTNMFCDVIPNATSTDTMELVGAAGVISSTVVPAATGTVIRAWIVPSPGYVVPDGGPVVVRHSPRDSVTGGWTSAVQDVTILGCAARTATTRTIVVPVVAPTGGVVVALFAQVSGLESNPATGPSNLYVSLPLTVGQTLVNIRARVQDGSVTRVQPTLLQQTDGPPTQTLAPVMAGPVSSGSGAEETLTFSPNLVIARGSQYVVKFANVTGFLTTSVFRLEVDVSP